jgi:hypothetical protein
MKITLREYWNGHGEPGIEVIENGQRVAAFQTEDEARAWCATEYGEDWVIE